MVNYSGQPYCKEHLQEHDLPVIRDLRKYIVDIPNSTIRFCKRCHSPFTVKWGGMVGTQFFVRATGNYLDSEIYNVGWSKIKPWNLFSVLKLPFAYKGYRQGRYIERDYS